MNSNKKFIIIWLVILTILCCYCGICISSGSIFDNEDNLRDIKTHYNCYGEVTNQTIYYPKSDIMYSYMYDYNWDEENNVNKLSKITILKIYVSKECADVVANYILDEESTYEEK